MASTAPAPAGVGRAVYLINPPNVYSKSGTTLIGIPPIGLAYVASSLAAQGLEVRIVDAYAEWMGQHRREEFGGVACGVEGATTGQILERIPEGALCVGITCMFMHQWPLVREIARAVHAGRPQVPILLGGEHVTGAYKYIMPEVPFAYACLGEGEATAVDFCRALSQGKGLDSVAGLAFFKDGRLEVTARRPRIRELDRLPWPAWGLIPLERYMLRKQFTGPSRGSSMPMVATRGCPYRCTFCTAPHMWASRWVARDPAEVVREMEAYRVLYGADDFQLVDLTTMIQYRWIESFCRTLIEKGWPGLRWQMPTGSRCEIMDENLAVLLYRSGCRNVVLAPESGSKRVLRRIKKRVDSRSVPRAVRVARRSKIRVECNFIIGFPDETLAEIAATWWSIFKLALLGVENIAYTAYRPTPGSALAEQAVSRGLLAFNDTVYMNVMHSSNLFRVVSASEIFGDRLLSILRFAGILLFYTTSFLVRPWRLGRLLVNLALGRQETRLERVVKELTQRRLRRSPLRV